MVGFPSPFEAMVGRLETFTVNIRTAAEIERADFRQKRESAFTWRAASRCR